MNNNHNDNSIRFFTAAHSVNVAEKTATFYLLNTSPNRDKWAVSAKALDEALPTLLGKPLGLGTNYEAGHSEQVGDMQNVGIYISTENKGNYALGTATISDTQVLEMIKTGKLGPVSVCINAYKISCSKCGNSGGITEKRHLCPEAYEVVESFVFTRVDFVKVPAYPQAGLLTLAASCLQSNSSAPLPLLAAAYEGSQTTTNNNKNRLLA